MKIARVFPRRTSVTPTDPLAFYGPPGMFPPDVAEVHVSVTFTYDLPRANHLARQWEILGVPVKIGGPGTGMRGEEFTPGMYLELGQVITSRGCLNRCWFCSVWKRDGAIRELSIKNGNIVQDDNLLQCSDDHIRRVFRMLEQQKERAVFRGGIEARRLKEWHIEEFIRIKTDRLFLAYDTPDDWEPLVRAWEMLKDTPLNNRHTLRCFVLVGWPRDTPEDAERRLYQTTELGLIPYLMRYRNPQGEVDNADPRFAHLTRMWATPRTIVGEMKRLAGEPNPQGKKLQTTFIGKVETDESKD